MLAVVMIIAGIQLANAQNVTHIVDRGETLATIAAKYGTTEARLIELNPDAAQFIYVGMELVVPGAVQPSSALSTPVPAAPVSSGSGVASLTPPAEPVVADDFESRRKAYTFEVGYSAGNFEYVKESGSYGFGFTALPWKIGNRFYGGLHCSPVNFNFGLVPSDYTSSLIMLGPALGYYFSPTTFVMLPIDVLCNVYSDEDDHTKCSWGMSFSPSLYVGEKVGLYVGPMINFSFEGDSKAHCGFRAGIYF